MSPPRSPQDWPDWMAQVDRRLDRVERKVAQRELARQQQISKPEWSDDEITGKVDIAELKATARQWRQRANQDETAVILQRQITRQDRLIKTLIGAIVLLVTAAAGIIGAMKL